MFPLYYFESIYEGQACSSLDISFQLGLFPLGSVESQLGNMV